MYILQCTDGTCEVPTYKYENTKYVNVLLTWAIILGTHSTIYAPKFMASKL